MQTTSTLIETTTTTTITTGIHRNGDLHSRSSTALNTIPLSREVNNMFNFGNVQTTSIVRNGDLFGRGSTAVITMPLSRDLNAASIEDAYNIEDVYLTN